MYIKYVLGFLFSPDFKKVVLVEKKTDQIFKKDC